MCGDYGGGKSATLLEAAIQKAKEGFTVFFISALDTGRESKNSKEFAGESVFDLALEERFRGSGVEVVTPRRMREQLGRRDWKGVVRRVKGFFKLGRRDEEDVLELIKEFLKMRGDKNMAQVAGWGWALIYGSTL